MKGYRRLFALILTLSSLIALSLLKSTTEAYTALGLIAGAYFAAVGVQKFKNPED